MNSRPSVKDAEDDGKAKGTSNAISADQVIQHLTKEIEVLSETVMTFRLRAAFTVWIGPYILLGSVIIATKGSFEISRDSPVLPVVALFAMALYLGLGWAAGRIEEQAWKQCNQWRDTISRLAAGEINSAAVLYEGMKFSGLQDEIRRAYLIVFLLILLSFLCVGFIAAHVQPKAEVTSHAPNTSHNADVPDYAGSHGKDVCWDCLTPEPKPLLLRKLYLPNQRLHRLPAPCVDIMTSAERG